MQLHQLVSGMVELVGSGSRISAGSSGPSTGTQASMGSDGLASATGVVLEAIRVKEKSIFELIRVVWESATQCSIP